MHMKQILWLWLLLLAWAPAGAQDLWQPALARMPLAARVTQLNRTNCVDTLLNSFQSNQMVKALVFMPGATDQLYFFRKVSASLTNASPTLLDAIAALTNQTLIRATFRPPLLLLHSHEDILEPEIDVEDPATVERLRQRRFLPHAQFNDRDWDFLEPPLRKTLKVEVRPWRRSRDSWHFYRNSFAAWNLTGWETIEALALADKAKVCIKRKQVIFTPDRRHVGP